MTEVFFPPPGPPQFLALDAELPLRVYERRLPHWRQPGATYFVTFRLGDSLPQEKLRLLRQIRTDWSKKNPEPQEESRWVELARDISTQAEKWLDEGVGRCVLREPGVAGVLARVMHHLQNEYYFLSCYCVMPNHCHVVVRPYPGHELEKIPGLWKGNSAVEINRHLGRSGALWAQESYDRIVRDAEHLFRVVQYIGNNPRKAQLKREQWIRWIDPSWETAGWGFRDPEK